MKPVANLWARIANGLVGRPFANADSLFRGVKQIWRATRQLFVRSLSSRKPANLRGCDVGCEWRPRQLLKLPFSFQMLSCASRSGSALCFKMEVSIGKRGNSTWQQALV